ncbi:hypothetical protein CIK96_10665 [Prevotella sp. P4-98]|uniref:efflux RND transporter periplasmic adaptor subunit n=1 Tax=Prevotella sp. P4-98 TaxID=2024219 RepID=UPI000B96979E|nr:efflux RND transporter periplasmic adaptor subunit [Prevotella sp. P4-98]OYP44823.1 hypothetical protein CIK96_10665 [Prevotella sp. P4-98]
MKDNIKRLAIVIAATLVAVGGFTLLSHGDDDHHDAHAGHSQAEDEHHDEEQDFKNIPLTAKQIATIDLKTDSVQYRELDATIRVNGSIVLRPQSMGNVASLMGGVVKNILVKNGQHVTKGQVVATIENTDVVTLQREYYAAYKECEMAQIEKQRQETLAQQGAGVQKNRQQAERNYQVAHATMIGIGRQLQQMGISTHAVGRGQFTTTFPLRAPISGTVCQLNAPLGSYADMQTPLMTIRNNDQVECDLNVFEKDLQKVNKGDRVLLALTNQPGIEVSGQVYGINDYFNDGTKSVAVHVKLDGNAKARLIDGMFVTGRIATGRKRCKALPSKAIINTKGKTYIFALDKKGKDGDCVFSRHEVTTGVTDSGYTEVELCKHIQDGQQIVTENVFYLASLIGEHGEHNH